MSRTLYNAITGWMYCQRNKHGFEENYAERLVNEMSQHDLLVAISDALEEAGVMPRRAADES